MTDSFTAEFVNEKTGEQRTFTFTLQQYLQARMWMTCPATESALELTIQLQASNINRQVAYCAVKVWKDEIRTKGAH